MTIWHNLLAMWLWRYLISGIEGISIPGVVSIIDLIIHYLPSYFLLTTAFLLAMLVTKKTSDTEKVSAVVAALFKNKPLILRCILLSESRYLVCQMASGWFHNGQESILKISICPVRDFWCCWEKFSFW